MAKFKMSLRHIPTGTELIDTEQLSSMVARGKTTVDDESISGLYDLVFNERRMKSEVRLINNNDTFNEHIRNLFTERLSLTDRYGNPISVGRLQDGLETEHVPALHFDKATILREMSNEKMWGTAYVSEELGQTYSPDNLGSGNLYAKSRMMIEIFYAMLLNFTKPSSIENEESDIYGKGTSGWDRSPFIQGNARIFVRKPDYKFKKIGFKSGTLNLLSFLADGVSKDYPNSLSDTETLNRSMCNYMNDLVPGLGAGFSTFIQSAADGNVEVNGVAIQHFLSGYTSSATGFVSFDVEALNNWNAIFFGLTTEGCGSTPRALRKLGLRLLDLYLCHFSENEGTLQFVSQGSPVPYHQFAIHSPDATYLESTPNWQARLAGFFSAILKFSWLIDMYDEWVSSGFDTLDGALLPNKLLFHKTKEPVLGSFNKNQYYRGTSGTTIPDPQTTTIAHIEETDVFLSVSNKYNNIFKHGSGTLRVLKNNPEKRLFFGEVQVKTSQTDEETENVVFKPQNIESARYPESSMFQPVRRVFVPKETEFFNPNIYPEYKVFSDGIDLKALSFQNYAEFALATMLHDEENWMYFDNVEVREYGCDYRNPNDIHFDAVPVFVPEEDADEYGLYLYRENFQDFYTKKPSNLLNVMVEVALDGKTVYLGIIDSSTISYDKHSLSFGATDILGITAENVKLLKTHLAWAQYSGRPQEALADKRSGMTLNDFMQALLYYGFPLGNYLSKMFWWNPETLPVFNEHKLLNKISAEDAFSTAIQCARKLLHINNNDGRSTFEFRDIDTMAQIRPLPKDRIISTSVSRTSSETERLYPEKLKNLAGFDLLMPEVAAFYNTLLLGLDEIVDIEVANYTGVKILDKISYSGNTYIVTSLSYDIARRRTKIKGVKTL